MSIALHIGDCRAVLATLPAASVHCVVTSPPYWGLRDYGVDGQLGLEPDFNAYVASMVAVFREVRRVLRDDGTLWLNLGDSYAAVNRGENARPRVETLTGIQVGNPHSDIRTRREVIEGQKAAGLKPKDLCGIPWRVAFALQADGWYLRQDIIWSKPNPMPESVTDRCTKAHEYLFLLSKRERYYYDADAIREPQSNGTYERFGNGKAPRQIDAKSLTANASEVLANASYKEATPLAIMPDGRRNKRSVWEVTTQPFSEAHFATFPPALIEPCIKAGTSEKGCCGKCGKPWMRQTETERRPTRPGLFQKGAPDRNDGGNPFKPETIVTTLGWSPSCTCAADVVPCTVLDPFAGAGTTGLVADRLQRNAVLIELNPTYAAMSSNRIKDDAPLFAEVAQP